MESVLATCKSLTDLQRALSAWSTEASANMLAALPAMAMISAQLHDAHAALVAEDRCARTGGEPPCAIGSMGE